MARRKRLGSVIGSARAEDLLRGTVAAASDVGKIRSNNEDSFLVFDLQKKASPEIGPEVRLPFARPGFLLAVADGMGGHSSGQVASQLCVDTLPAELLKILPDSASTVEEFRNALREAVEATNRVVYTTGRQNPANEGMGTTLTAAWIAGTQAIVAQVGDSRAYLLHQDSLRQLTRDQTVLDSVSEAEREALLHTPLENMLLQAVGSMARLEVAVSTAELTPGDFLLLCSDGLYRVLSAPQLTAVLQEPQSGHEKVQTLIQRANQAGAPDNVTAILCEVQRSEAE